MCYTVTKKSCRGAVFLYKQCRTEQSAARQRELELGLMEVMKVQHYDEITVSSLCQRLQIPRKSFYRYFSSKEGALHALIDHALLDFVSFTTDKSSGQSSGSREEAERMFAYWPLLDALAKSGLSGVLVQRAIENSMMETLQAKRFRSQDEQDAQEYGTLFAVSGFMSMVIQWHHDGYRQSIEQMTQIALDLVSRPLASDVFQK